MNIKEYIPFTDAWYERKKRNARELLGAEISLLETSVQTAEARNLELAKEKGLLETGLTSTNAQLEMLREDNGSLRQRLLDEKINRDELIRGGVLEQLGDVKGKISSIEEAYHEQLRAALQGRVKHLTPELIMEAFPKEAVYPCICEFLVQNSHMFKMAPVAVFRADGSQHPYYRSGTFERYCDAPDGAISSIIQTDIEKIRHGWTKGYETKLGAVDLTFRPLGNSFSDKIQAVAVYATPPKDRKRARKIFKSMVDPVLSLLQNTIEDVERYESGGGAIATA